MATKKVTPKKKAERNQFHHLGSPEVLDASYNSDNMEYMIVLNANASNTHFLGKHVQTGDELYLGLSEQDAEALCEQLLSAISDRLKQKLERYNQQKKAFWLSEFREEEKNWKDSAWNSFTK
jgi:hypothetical protein